MSKNWPWKKNAKAIPFGNGRYIIYTCRLQNMEKSYTLTPLIVSQDEEAPTHSSLISDSDYWKRQKTQCIIRMSKQKESNITQHRKEKQRKAHASKPQDPQTSKTPHSPPLSILFHNCLLSCLTPTYDVCLLSCFFNGQIDY